jgi:hypothetical protein
MSAEPMRQPIERTWYPTPVLMQHASAALFTRGRFSRSDELWIADQLGQRAAAILEGQAT